LKKKIIIKDFLETTNNNQAQTASASAASIQPPATNVIRQGSKALPTLDERKKPTGDNRFSSKGTNSIDKERIINIDTLNPYMNKFVFNLSLVLKNQ
jgi:hypothetical protein